MKKIVISLLILSLLTFNVSAKDKVTLKKCVDGDTAQFILNNEEIKVRFLAIDTPESVHPTKKVEDYGKEASEFTCNILSNAKVIELEYENNKTDKYGRTLAWVWTDDVLLQDTLVSNGYAEVAYIYGNYKYTDLLKDHQAIAEAKKLNIWSDNINSDSINEDSLDIKAIMIGIFIILVLYILYKNNIITKNEFKKSIKKLNRK